jgi:hypothetical protein
MKGLPSVREAAFSFVSCYGYSFEGVSGGHPLQAAAISGFIPK